jgi:hypothetical protein
MQMTLGNRLIIPTCMALVLLPGCTQRYYAPPPRAQLDGLTQLSLKVTAAPTALFLDKPVSGSEDGALTGAAQGGGGSLMGGASVCQGGEAYSCAAGLFLGIILAAPAAIIGGVVGASLAREAEEVDSAALTLEKALADVKVTDGIRAALVRRARDKLDLDIVPPASHEDSKPGKMTEAPETVASLELTADEFKIVSLGKIDPDLRVEMTINATLSRGAGAGNAYYRGWKYQSKTQNYFALAADNAKGLKEMIAASYEKLARRVIYDLFLARHPQSITAGDPEIRTSDAPIIELDEDPPANPPPPDRPPEQNDKETPPGSVE